MENIFEKFKELYSERNSRIRAINMGEDSVRYDFFVALSEIMRLNSYDIMLESPIDNNAFVARNNPHSQRKEKPIIDLVVRNDNLNFCAEFGLFRQNSNPEGNINKTARIGKMINDMLRLGLHSYCTNSNAYFICVADSKILGHKLKSNIYGPFPAKVYLLNPYNYSRLSSSAKKRIDQRFINKQNELDVSFVAKLIFDKNVETELNNLKTKILIWEIKKRIKKYGKS